MKRFLFLIIFGISTLAAPLAVSGDELPPVPVTRPEIKKTLEGSKHSHPRLPLPPVTAEEKAQGTCPLSFNR